MAGKSIEEICWCGCGEKTTGSWAPGHDHWAEAKLIEMEYGDIRAFLERHGYSPDGKNLRQAVMEWQMQSPPHSN